MDKAKTVLQVEQLISPILEEQEFELVGVELKRELVGLVLRIFIDREDGVDLDACSRASEVIGQALGRANLIATPYNLEVSSPGIERPLKKPKDFQRFIGSNIFVRTIKPLNNRRQFKGVLKSAGDESFAIQCDGELVEIPYGLVSKAHLVVSLVF
ncbi:MAG TPA: ribosome maturation factor RimP [Actinobacteria bacterium]|nr:ribosome maturation factor RimP [Actinomycetota bacterium]